MKTIIILLTIITSIIIIWGKISLKWNLNKITNIITIYGIAAGILIYFQVSTQLVEIEPKANLKLFSFDAIRTISVGHETIISPINKKIPPVYFKGYLCNIGNALSNNIAFEFKWDKFNSKYDIGDYLSYLIYYESSQIVPDIESLRWPECDSCKSIDKVSNGWYRIYIPPIFPSKLVGILVVLNENFINTLSIKEITNLTHDYIKLRLVQYSDRLIKEPIEKKVILGKEKLDIIEDYILPIRQLSETDTKENY